MCWSGLRLCISHTGHTHILAPLLCPPLPGPALFYSACSVHALQVASTCTSRMVTCPEMPVCRFDSRHGDEGGRRAHTETHPPSLLIPRSLFFLFGSRSPSAMLKSLLGLAAACGDQSPLTHLLPVFTSTPPATPPCRWMSLCCLGPSSIGNAFFIIKPPPGGRPYEHS